MDKIEAKMVPLLVEAIYPELIPVEQQDMRIQAKNHERITRVAQAAWRAWIDQT